MSSLPGYNLEDYIAWQWGMIIVDQLESNVSVGVAEALGLVTDHRPCLTPEQFKPLLDLYEPHREHIECRLADFDEDNQSWRDYSQYVDDCLSEEEAKQIETLAQQLRFKHTPKEKVANYPVFINHQTPLQGLFRKVREHAIDEHLSHYRRLKDIPK